MTTLRRRILLTVAPLAALIVAIGVSGISLLDHLGRQAEAIIRENYVSLAAMADLTGHLAAAERVARTDPEQFRAAIAQARAACAVEQGNITIPGEQEATDDLTAAVEEVARTGDPAAFALARHHVGRIRTLNEQAMYAADDAAKTTARQSSRWLGLAVVVALALAALAASWLQRTILEPIRTVTAAATAIGQGDWQRVVVADSDDEVGQLVAAFNVMAVKLRAYRQTDQNQLARARRAAQATVDTFPDPVIVLDPTGRVELANPAAARLFGIGPPPWQPPESLQAAIAEASRGRAVLTESFDEAVTFRVGGDERSYLPQIRPVAAPDGEALGLAVVLNDITPFRLLDRLKSDWVATVSHELKTPLTSLQLALHVLLEEIVGPLEPKQTELLLEARDNADRLARLVQQLLALAKLEDQRDALDRHPADPGDLLRTAADGAAARAEDKAVSLQVDAASDLPSVLVDEARFGPALANLVENAVTYTGAGGTVTLSAAATAGRVTLAVSDTGIGIPAADLPHVFERFFRVAGRDTPGTGLGLAIARDVVSAHGGTITCASEAGRGTTFTITLTAAPEGP